MKLRTLFTIGIAIVSIYFGWYAGYKQRMTPYQQIMAAASNSIVISTDEHILRLQMRELWTDTAVWIRLYNQDLASGTTFTDADLVRLNKNQDDIGALYGKYFGEVQGLKLTEILKKHIMLTTQVIQAIEKNDIESLEVANADWYTNADQIAHLLANSNTHWSQTEIRTLFHTSMDLIKRQAVDISEKKHDATVDDFDKMNEQMLQTADNLSDGIVRQFPDKF